MTSAKTPLCRQTQLVTKKGHPTDLYRERICGALSLPSGLALCRKVAVPLAHQSALAGITLVAQLVSA
jgi:hypothetical protein